MALQCRHSRQGAGAPLGKTILFAKNNAHAEYVAERFNAHYPHLKGHFARVITFKTEYAQSLIDDFSNVERARHIAVSVDMLDTGIDVPEVLNLVFFKVVRSKTKFWQMVGRGTRLCQNIFGPGLHKSEFLIFDFCQNLPNSNAALGESLGTRIFRSRLELLAALDAVVLGVDAARLYESPFTDVSPAGPEELFSTAQIDRIVEVLRDVRAKVA